MDIFGFKRRREQREAYEEEIKRLRKEEADLWLLNRQTEMLEAYCPINGGKCFSECTHYEPGFVRVNNGDIWDIYREPKCKLWGTR